jgi:hypothetical protein
VIYISDSKRFSAGYRLGPTVIDVEADDPDAARWLAEFLTPWIETTTPGKGDFAVRLTCSASTFAALEHRHATAIPHSVACFALDTQVISLPGRTEDNGGTVIADSRFGCFYRVHGQTVEVVSRPRVRRVRIGLMRVVRELAAAQMLRREGILDLHSAAFAVGGRGVLLVGPKGAGKTTLLVSVLALRQASLLANDRVFIDAGRHPSQAIGVPTLASLQEGTLQLFPILRRGLPDRPAWMHAGELESPGSGAFENDEPPTVFALSPTQLAQRLGVAMVREGLIAAVVFPEIAATADARSIEAVAPADGAAQLRKYLYGIRSRPRPRTIFEELVGGRGAPADNEIALVDRLAAEAPFFRCRLGRDGLHDGAKALVQTVFPDQASRMGTL